MSGRATLAICAAKRRGGEVKVERVEQADVPSESMQAADSAEDAIPQHGSEEDCSKDLGFEPAMLPRLKFKKLRALAMRYVYIATPPATLCTSANPTSNPNQRARSAERCLGWCTSAGRWLLWMPG